MYIIKFFYGHLATIPFAQIDDFVSIKITNDAIDISSATVILKSTVEGYDRLDRVEICQVSPELNTDIVIFRGLISSIRGTLFTTEVQILGMKAFLKRKILLADVAGTMNMSLFLTSICNSWNTQTGDSLTYSIPYDFSVTVDAKTGDNFFGVITDLIASKQVTIGTSLSYLLFDFDLIKITIAPLLGIDRTIPGDTYMCAYYSLSDIHDSTVQDVTMIDDDITANYLIVKNPTYSLTSDPSRMNFPKLGYYYDTPNKTNYLSILQTEHSHQKNIEITLSQIFLKKYGVTNLAGDKIVVDIVKNQYVSYQGTAYILTDEIYIDRNGVVRTLGISTNYLKTPDFVSEIIKKNRKLFIKTL